MTQDIVKKNKINIIKHIFVFVFCLFIIFLLSIPLSKKLTKQYGVNEEIKKLEQEIAQEEARNYELKKMLEFLNSEEYIEQEARTSLNYKGEGETVLVVQDKKDEVIEKKQEGQGKDEKIVVNENNFKKWKRYFFN